VGGPHGYALFLEIIADRDHEQYEDMIRWIGGVFDSKGFDLNRPNRDWKVARARRWVVHWTFGGHMLYAYSI
jgi:hypothetical protein